MNLTVPLRLISVFVSEIKRPGKSRERNCAQFHPGCTEIGRVARFDRNLAFLLPTLSSIARHDRIAHLEDLMEGLQTRTPAET